MLNQLMLSFRQQFYILFLVMGFFMGPVSFASDDGLEQQMQEVKSQSESIVKQLEIFQKQQPGNNDSLSEDEKIDKGVEFAEKNLAIMLSRYRKMSYADLRSEVKDTLMATRGAPVVKRFPKIIDFVAHIFKDPYALKRVLEMSKDRKKMKDVGLYLLATVLIGWLLGKIFIRKGLRFSQRVIRIFIKFIAIWFVRIGIIVHFYGYYLGPTAKIFKRVFLPFI